MREVSVLFARADSIYKTLPGCDVWDAARDARKWHGGTPVVAHPPCRGWGQLRHFARPIAGEIELATWAVDQVRKFGGVLEHPKGSRLWISRLPYPGETDEFGGWTLPILQFWFGHRCEKATWLYIVGLKCGDIPPIPFVLGEATHVIASSRKRGGHRPEVPKSEREHTPLQLAEWLVQLARSSKRESST